MREFTKSTLSFSWAMSLFGIRQLASLAGLGAPQGAIEQPPSATAAFDQVTRATAEQFGGSLETVFRTGDWLQRGMTDLMFGFAGSDSCGQRRADDPTSDGRWRPDAVREADGRQREEVITRRTEGTGRFTEDGKIVLTTAVYGQDGRDDGYQETVFDVSYVLDPQMMNVWYQWFDLPRDDYFDPYKPDHKAAPMEVRAQTETTWTCADRSSISTSGPAFFNLARFKDGSSIFFLTVAAGVKSGTGRYLGVEGIQTSLGSALIERGAAFGPGSVFRVRTTETFRVIRRADMEIAAPEWPYRLDSIKVENERGQSFDMSYVDVGSGDPILFLHGNPSWSYVWRNIIPHLSPLGRCIAPDLVGMGPSPKPDELNFTYVDHVQFINDFIRKLGLKNITFVVHDWGTALGFDYASDNEANVKGLAFMEAVYKSYPDWQTFPEPDAPQLVRDNFRTFREGYPDKNSAGYKMIVEQNVFLDVLTPTVMGRAVPRVEMDWDREPFKEPKSREVIWRWVNQIPVAGMPEETTRAVDKYHAWLLRTNLPKLLLYVSPGMILTADSVRWLRDNLTNLTLINVGPGLHYPQETNPYLVGTEIAGWYRGLPSSTGTSQPR
jgi:haloalkane dehalogenase